MFDFLMIGYEQKQAECSLSCFAASTKSDVFVSTGDGLSLLAEGSEDRVCYAVQIKQT